MALARIHPGLAALAVVAGAASIFMLFQSTVLKQPTLDAPRSASVAPSTTAQRAKADRPLSGIARVIDGDTIAIGGTRVRLDGIDAPESKQTCTLNGQEYRCGQRAIEALITLVGAQTVTCTETGKDRNRRVIARCRVEGIDIGTWLVEHGWAVAFRKYSLTYVPAEERARSTKAGMWAGTFMLPENWRRNKTKGEHNGQR